MGIELISSGLESQINPEERFAPEVDVVELLNQERDMNASPRAVQVQARIRRVNVATRTARIHAIS
jgi:hypothetical protein